MYMIKASIENPRHPEYGSVTIPFPIPETEYDNALRLLSELEIGSGKGRVTPYGVFYENDMKLRQIYDGMHLPPYLYQPCEAVLFISPQDRPEESEALYFPCSGAKIDRAMQRLDVDSIQQCNVSLDECFRLGCSVRQIFEANGNLWENLESFRRLTEIASGMDQERLEEFQTLLDLFHLQEPDDVLTLAENFEHLTLDQNIFTPEELGWRRAEELSNLGPDSDFEVTYYINFEEYGEDVARRENGIFTEQGYLTCSSHTPEMRALIKRLYQNTEPAFEQDMGGM